MTARLLITPGEPAGIGPDLALEVAHLDVDFELVLVADPSVISERALCLNRQIRLIEIDINSPVTPHEPGTLKIIPVLAPQPVVPGIPDARNSAYVIRCLDVTTDACLSGNAAGLITGPINKATINDADIPFTGHTEHLQRRCGVDQVVMMLATDDLKVALVTTHLPLRAVADAITVERLDQILSILISGLQTDFGLAAPRILVAGLNPHAGENGYLGTEEQTIIEPTLAAWRERGAHLIGPLPADTLFTAPWLAQADAVLAMYHDQGLPVLKYAGFGQAVNITLGLPIVRTSVDHGTAFDLAGKGTCHVGSFLQAVHIARNMAAIRATTTHQA